MVNTQDATITGVTVNPTTATVAPGGTQNILVTVSRTAGSTAAQTFTCTTSNSAVATVTVGTGANAGNCVVSVPATATAGATADITATSSANTGKSAKATITVGSPIAAFKLDAGKASGTPAAGWTLDASNTGWGCFTDATLATAVTGANGTPTANNATQVTTVTGAGTGNFAPQSVYLDERYCTSGGNFSVAMRYARTAATAGLYKVRVHFAELYNGTGLNPAGGPRIIRVRVDNGATAGTFQDVTLPVAGSCTTTGGVTTCSSTPVAVDLPVAGNVAAGGTINVVVAAKPNGTNTANTGDPTVAGIEFLPQ